MSLTVKELIEQLAKLPEDALVVQSEDGEGNGFSPAANIELGVYEAECTWAGQFFEVSIIGDEEYDQPGSDAVVAVCIWPTN